MAINKNLPTPFRQPRFVAPEIIEYPYAADIAAESEPGSQHFHWTIQAYSKRDDNGVLIGSTVVTVEAADENSAIARAMAILVRPFYRVSSVEEVCRQALKE